MKRLLQLLAALLCAATVSSAQGPVLRQADTWTYSYEDISDFMRIYPGIYPLDYGTMGAPLVFRPWRLDPWTLDVRRDGIPQSRRYDGLFMANLQPVGELDTLRFDFLQGGGTGQFELATRRLPVDSPYTEFQIREGFYGYGTIDMAHAQRIYRSFTAELTGRLVWYNGFNLSQGSLFGATREYRLRGRFGVDLGERWRTELTYGGANDNAELNYASALAGGDRFTQKLYEEREEGMLTLSRKDSFRTALDPRVTVFLRQDREQWHGPFRAREQMSGAILEAHAALPRQGLTLRQQTTYTVMNFPGMPEALETALELKVNDSADVVAGSLDVWGGARWESLRLAATRTDEKLLADVGVRFESRPVAGFALHGGSQYVEQTIPAAWRYGRYAVGDRPLLVSPLFADTGATFVGAPVGEAGSADRYLKNMVGLRWQRFGARVDLQLLSIRKSGNLETAFRRSAQQEIFLERVSRVNSDTPLGYYGEVAVPLRWGLRVESWGFMQATTASPSTDDYQRAFSRLYFERDFFKTPLIIRSHLSYEYLGQRTEFSDAGTATLPPAYLMGFRLSATIKGVTLMWGTENLLNQSYSLLPGYPRIGKEEYLQFIWRLWL